MKVRIVEKGWAGYTGHLGMIEFADGVSVEDIGRGDAASLAAIVAIEDIATDKSPSDAQRMIDANAHLTVPVEVRLTGETTPAAPVESKTYTREELEEIADKGGIKALRDLAEPMGLKDNSIVQLISKILAFQAPAPAANEVVAEVPAKAAAEAPAAE